MRFLLSILLFLIAGSSIYSQADSTYFLSGNSFLILFETDKADVDSIDIITINKIKNYLRRLPECNVRLAGRADFRGSDQYNLQLAARRVDSVRSLLIAKGISGDRFEASIFGESEPMASNKTERGMQLNRSVQIQLGCKLPSTLLTGQVVSDSTGLPVRSRIFVQSKYHFDTLSTDTNGYFEGLVPDKNLISIEIFGKGHYREKEYIRLDKTIAQLGPLKALPFRAGLVFHFSDILFVGSQDVILPEYRNQLPRLYYLIKGAPEYHFEIQGHVNYPNEPPQQKGTFQYDLAERRAKRIYGYLIESGIDSSNLEWNGYSNWKMLYPKARSSEHQQKNRRVSIKVLGRIDD